MIRSGFFNSKNHDKKYYASDLSKLFQLLVTDGVFSNEGNKFISRPGQGMQVIVPSGMSWFNGSWTSNDSDYIINLDEAPYVAGFSRIDGIFIVSYPNNDRNTRDNTIIYVKGTETSSSPTKPVPVSVDGERYNPICYIHVANGDTAVTADKIENSVGTEETPFVTGILETANVSELLNQWEAQWSMWLNSRDDVYESDIEAFKQAKNAAFDVWFNNVRDRLSEDVATDLQNQIDRIVGFYVQDGILYLPNSDVSVSNGVLTIGTIEGGV